MCVYACICVFGCAHNRCLSISPCDVVLELWLFSSWGELIMRWHEACELELVPIATVAPAAKLGQDVPAVELEFPSR